MNECGFKSKIYQLAFGFMAAAIWEIDIGLSPAHSQFDVRALSTC